MSEFKVSDKVTCDMIQPGQIFIITHICNNDEDCPVYTLREVNDRGQVCQGLHEALEPDLKLVKR
jgi:hypothetical protein